jgi:hypothetical protein
LAGDIALDLFRADELQLLIGGSDLLDFKVTHNGEKMDRIVGSRTDPPFIRSDLRAVIPDRP